MSGQITLINNQNVVEGNNQAALIKKQSGDINAQAVEITKKGISKKKEEKKK